MLTIPSPIIRYPADDWVSEDRYALVCACGCNIQSGATYSTPQAAARETMHGGYKKHPGIAVWDGTIEEVTK